MKNLKFEVVFLFFIMLFAIYVTNGKTIAFGLLPLLFFFKRDINLSKNRLTIKEGIFYFFLVFSVFILNFLVVYDFNKNTINLPHPDFHFYLKVAKNFLDYGIENNLTARNVVFEELNFSTPYRFFDTWILAVLLNIFNFSDLQILQLIYIPIVLLLVVFSVYKNTHVNSMYLKGLLSFMFLFLFGDYFSSTIFFGGNNAEVCVVSYPKLAIFFCVFIYFIKSQLSSNVNPSSIIYLAFLPILIQTAFPIYILVFAYLIFHFRIYRTNLKVVAVIAISVLYFVVFYYYNSLNAKNIFSVSSFQTVKSPLEYFSRVTSIAYNLIFLKSLFFLLILLFLMFFAVKERRVLYLKIIVISLGILFSGLLVYAYFPSSPNSYQFLTNFIKPLFISLIYILSLDVIQHFKSITKSALGFSIIILLGAVGLINQVFEYGFFNTKDNFSSSYDNDYRLKLKKSFQSIDNPIGLTLWSLENSNRSNNEYFDQFGTSLLLNFGAKYDVLCLSALEVKEGCFADKLYKHTSAISIYSRLNRNVLGKNLKQSFYKHYKFEYLFSDIGPDELPSFIKRDIQDVVYNTNNKIYFYKLNRN